MPDLITEPCEFWMVWTKTGHIPRRMHNTQAEAEAEADRLASLKPYGKKYIVLRGYRKCHIPQDAPDCDSSLTAPASVHEQVAA